MKKAIALCLSLLCCTLLFACADGRGGDKNTPVEFTVTFVQDGVENVVKTVKTGDRVELPKIVAQPPIGYTYVWERTDFSAIEQNLTVRLKKVANTYTVYFDIGDDPSASIESLSQTVTYDGALSLYTPTRYGYVFSGWLVKDASTPFAPLTYTVVGDTYLVAKWTVDPDSDRWFTPDL